MSKPDCGPDVTAVPPMVMSDSARAMPAAGIEYRWLEALGGRRPKSTQGESPNLGLRNESFRNYADYMRTDAFRSAVQQLLEFSSTTPTAYMCSESVFWRCHRRLVSDFLFVQGITVEHIMPTGELRPHTLTSGARVVAGELTYPPPGERQSQLLFDCSGQREEFRRWHGGQC